MKFKKIERFEIEEIEKILKKNGFEIDFNEDSWGTDFLTLGYDVIGENPVKVEFVFLINDQEKRYKINYYSIQKTIFFEESKTEYYFINCENNFCMDNLWFDGVNIIVENDKAIAELRQCVNNEYIRFELKDIKIEFTSSEN